MILFIISDAVLIAGLLISVLPLAFAAENLSTIITLMMIGTCIPALVSSIACIKIYKADRENGVSSVGKLIVNFLLHLGLAVGMLSVMRFIVSHDHFLSEGVTHDPLGFVEMLLSMPLCLLALIAIYGVGLFYAMCMLPGDKDGRSMYVPTFIGIVVSAVEMFVVALCLS